MDCAVFSKRSSQPLKKQDEDVFGSGSENSVLDSEEFPSFASSLKKATISPGEHMNIR